MMAQQGPVFAMKSSGPSGAPLWEYRYRTGGRGSRRVQRGGFPSERDAAESLDRALDRRSGDLDPQMFRDPRSAVHFVVFGPIALFTRRAALYPIDTCSLAGSRPGRS